MKKILVRKFKGTDIQDSLVVLRLAISESCKLDHDGKAERIESWLANKTEQNIIKWMEDTNLHLVAALVNDQVVGVGMCTAAGEISLCYVLPSFQRTGIGKSIVEELEDALRKLGVTRSVLVSTFTVLKFYSHVGYEINGKIINHFGVSGVPMSRDFQMPRVPFC